MSDERRLTDARINARRAIHRVHPDLRYMMAGEVLALWKIRSATLDDAYWNQALDTLTHFAPTLAVQLRHLLQLGHIAELQERQQ